ncbi:MAG: CPBP family intramembrane metalloprotease, partial [Elusimicrobia bacterium]|nr:CPBP family intramembrane metalloprotease [Elusimicrobiota bacterium]
MKISPRRALSTLLAAALLLGSVPPAVQAQVVRLAAGRAGGMPVSPVAGPVTGMTMAPAPDIGAASLHGAFSAPSIAPSPAGAATVAAAAPIALAVAARAAAAEAAPVLPDAPKAAAPAAKKTWGQRLAAMMGRKTAPASAPSAESSKADADTAFDGAADKGASPEGVPVTAGEIILTRNGLKSALTGRLALAAENRKLHVDEFGGPLGETMNFKTRVVYGLKQGLNLVGIGALLNATLRPLLDLFPWPQYLSDTALHGFGRVALLAKYGPNEIVAGLASSPATFLGLTLPMAVTMEEITYRLFGFGLTFLALAAVKPFTRWLSTMIDGLPDAAGAVGGAKRVLKLGDWLSRLAFPIAAALSSVNFAVAHFASWGFSPFVFALNLILGLFLARTAYKSRGLTAPVIAHLIFNLVTIGGLLVAMAVSPFAGAAFAVIAGLIGASSLLHGWLTARKERAFRIRNGGKAFAALLILALSFSALNGPSPSPAREASSRASTVISRVMDQKVEVPAVPAAADTAAIESRADMVARVKPSVVNVIVHMP